MGDFYFYQSNILPYLYFYACMAFGYILQHQSDTKSKTTAPPSENQNSSRVYLEDGSVKVVFFFFLSMQSNRKKTHNTTTTFYKHKGANTSAVNGTNQGILTDSGSVCVIFSLSLLLQAWPFSHFQALSWDSITLSTRALLWSHLIIPLSPKCTVIYSLVG